MPERYRPPSREELEASLAERKARLADYEARGTAALSRFDIEIAHRGNADYALKEALGLLRNHIAYYEKELAPYREQPQQTSFFLPDGEVIAVAPEGEQEDTSEDTPAPSIDPV